MGVDELPLANSAPRPYKQQRTLSLRVQYVALVLLASAGSALYWNSLSASQTGTRHVVPMHAKEILTECASLHLVPSERLGDLIGPKLIDRSLSYSTGLC